MTGSTRRLTAITHATPALPLIVSIVRAAGCSPFQTESTSIATIIHVIACLIAPTAGQEMARTALCASLVTSRAPHARTRTSMPALTVLHNSLTEWLARPSVTQAASEAFTRQLRVTRVRHVTSHAVTVQGMPVAAFGATQTVKTLSFTKRCAGLNVPKATQMLVVFVRSAPVLV